MTISIRGEEWVDDLHSVVFLPVRKILRVEGMGTEFLRGGDNRRVIRMKFRSVLLAAGFTRRFSSHTLNRNHAYISLWTIFFRFGSSLPCSNWDPLKRTFVFSKGGVPPSGTGV